MIPQVSCLVLIQFLRKMLFILYATKAVETSVLFSVPQKVLGRCVNGAPVAFLNNFEVECVTLLRSCPTGFPLQTLLTDLRIKVKNGEGGMSHLL